MAYLSVENLEKAFGGTRVLRDVSFQLPEGETLSVIGSSGSGKTTLLDALSFFRRTMLDKPENKNMGMGYVPFLLDNHSRKKHFLLQMLKASDFIYHSLEVFI